MNEKPPEEAVGAAEVEIVFAVVFGIVPKLSVGSGFDEPRVENDENEPVPNGATVPNEDEVLVFIDGINVGAIALRELLAPNPTDGLLDVTVVEEGTKLKALLPNGGGADDVVDGDVKLLEVGKALAVVDIGGDIDISGATDVGVTVEELNKLVVVGVKEGTELIGVNAVEVV